MRSLLSSGFAAICVIMPKFAICRCAARRGSGDRDRATRDREPSRRPEAMRSMRSTSGRNYFVLTLSKSCDNQHYAEKKTQGHRLLVGERSRKLRKSYINSDREALAGDVVSVLGSRWRPSRKIPRFSREIEKGDFGGA